MVTLGTDAHKLPHTVVAVDGNGRRLGQKTVDAVAQSLEALCWASQWSERRWAVEDCRHACAYVTGVDADPGILVIAGRKASDAGAPAF